MKLRLPNLQSNNNQAKKLQAIELFKRWEDIKKGFQYGGFSYIPEIIQLKLINQYYNTLLTGHFGIDKTQELIARKYYLLTLHQNVEDYVKGCNVCLAFKAVWHKLYGNLQALQVPTHR